MSPLEPEPVEPEPPEPEPARSPDADPACPACGGSGVSTSGRPCVCVERLRCERARAKREGREGAVPASPKRAPKGSKPKPGPAPTPAPAPPLPGLVTRSGKALPGLEDDGTDDDW